MGAAAGAPGPAGSRAPEFQHLIVHKGQLTLRDAPRDLALSAQVRTREGAARDAAGLFVRAAGQYRGQGFTAEARSPGLLQLLAGEPANATGETVTTRGALVIPGAPRPDVYIAALGRTCTGTCSWRTSGTCTWMTGPATLRDHVSPALRQAAADAGRPQGSVRVVASLPVAVTDDVEAARKQAAEQFAVYGTLPSYRAMLDREGYAGPEDAAIIGDEATVRDRLAELAEAGVDEYVGAVFDSSAEGRDRTRALLRDMRSGG
jgi:alkanesulfonate monooxygenase SsuD/methylene tetrahydromethanopterin reductase-like flavin-dependent oxidoreductase (luciferase family)